MRRLSIALVTLAAVACGGTDDLRSTAESTNPPSQPASQTTSAPATYDPSYPGPATTTTPPPATATSTLPPPMIPTATAVTAQPGDATPSSVRRISVAEAMQASSAGTALFVDVRSADSFAANHIKGAVHLAYNDVAARANTLPKDKLIILYCT